MFIRLASFLLTLAIVAAGVAAWGYNEFTRPGPLSENTIAVIPAGSGLGAIADQLQATGIIRDRWVFVIGAKATGADRTLRAGEFEFTKEISPEGTIAVLESGKVIQHRITFAEGLTAEQVVALLNEDATLTGAIPIMPEEGSLLPETYNFTRGDTREAIIDRMQFAMKETLQSLWDKRDPDLPITSPRQALILASMVERETGVAGERAMIAGVFMNRLRRKMRLQSDPTVVYGLAPSGDLGRPLTRADLKIKHPYNTYVLPALPAGPIANPGRASLTAVMHPAVTKNLYFVADGSGGHAFASSLREHNRNVAKWRKFKASQKP